MSDRVSFFNRRFAPVFAVPQETTNDDDDDDGDPSGRPKTRTTVRDDAAVRGHRRPRHNRGTGETRYRATPASAAGGNPVVVGPRDRTSAMSNIGGGGGVAFESLQNVATKVFPPIYVPNAVVGGGTAANGTRAVNYTSAAADAIEREYVEDYVFQATFSFVYLLIFTLGVFGNALVVYVVWANKHMRTVTNIFIVNLAVSDVMLCGLAVPFTPLYTFTGTRTTPPLPRRPPPYIVSDESFDRGSPTERSADRFRPGEFTDVK